jgi:CheY-like chemotaxis protein
MAGMTLDSTRNILVASDDQALVAAISGSLRASGFAVCSETPGRAQHPSLIVLDADLSSEARARLLHTCRAVPEQSTPPIVALAPPTSLRQTAAQDGVWVCLAKPIELETLLSAIQRICHYTADTRLPERAAV